MADQQSTNAAMAPFTSNMMAAMIRINALEAKLLQRALDREEASATPRPKGDGQVSEWQPIETAPRDGTEVLVAYRDRGKYEVDLGYYQNATAIPGERGGWCTSTDYHFAIDPTHWMPLPEPPKDLDPQPKIG